jgi:hypothetical protein
MCVAQTTCCPPTQLNEIRDERERGSKRDPPSVLPILFGCFHISLDYYYYTRAQCLPVRVDDTHECAFLSQAFIFFHTAAELALRFDPVMDANTAAFFICSLH